MLLEKSSKKFPDSCDTSRNIRTFSTSCLSYSVAWSKNNLAPLSSKFPHFPQLFGSLAKVSVLYGCKRVYDF